MLDLRPEAGEPEDGSTEPWWPVGYVDQLDVERFQPLFVESLTTN